MSFWNQITSNYLINLAFISWMAAQLIKTLLTFLTTHTFVPERLVGAGGMPSSHSALVCSLTVGMAKEVGFSSPIFALTLCFAGVVMYDAMGVRRAAGEHAKVLNRMVFDFKDLNKDLSHFFTSVTGKQDSPFSEDAQDRSQTPDLYDEEDKRLKEFLGHTPLEVLGGALLGILIATLMPT